MARRTLIDFFEDFQSRPGEFILHDDGYRGWSYTYGELVARAHAFAARLRAEGIPAGDKVVIWSENRPEWIVALWGCLLEGVVLVPIDYRASTDFLLKVADIVDARAILVGDTVGELTTSRPIWPLAAVAVAPDLVVAPDLKVGPTQATGVGPTFRSGVTGDTGVGPTVRSGRTSDTGVGPTFRSGATSDTGVGPTFRSGVTGDTTAEILFTSGATAEPKGVVLTHKNILANIVPVEREINKYKKYARPFSPIRFLNLLPLSHMFGQSMATFVPPMLDGVVVFTRSYSPHDIVRQIRERRVSVLVCVPKMLEVLRDHILRVHPEAAEPPPPGHWAKRWWKYRAIHRTFGFKFWAIVVGAAPLDPELEAFWGRLGFLVVQGYGLTETAPIVTLNHPLHASRGAVGKPISGVQVRIAEDGEILVRGDNVTTGYYNAPEETQRAFRDGWFHTGDIGDLDAEGRLRIRGRKKEMIVTPEGLNVFPEDVERVLNARPGVRDSAVVGAPTEGSTGTTERVHAVLVVDDGTDLEAVVRDANAQLQDHQKIRAAHRWTSGELPRTEGTRKLKRRELRQWISGQGSVAGPAGGRDVGTVVARFAAGRAVTPGTSIDALGLSSLERVELMMALEETFQVTIDEGRFAAAATVADLEHLVQPLEGAPTGPGVTAVEPLVFPSWNRSPVARSLRRASLPTWILPPMRLFVSLEVRGLQHLKDVAGPVIFAANHQSHFDAPAILQALPGRWKYRVAPAMLKEFFKAHFYPNQYPFRARLTSSINYYLSTLFFNAFPLPQREAGTRQTLRYIGEILGDGYSILIFPEGKRTDTGEIIRFQPGVGMIAARLGVPVVPVRIEGLDKILHHTWTVPKRGVARVTFGPPISLTGHDYAALAARVEEAVKGL